MKIIVRQTFFSYIAIICIILGIVFVFWNRKVAQANRRTYWEFQSIDTMKYSRDVSREKLKDPSFAAVIDKQVKDIAETGATHVAIATPYDEEFIPFLTQWVKTARKYGLLVWFRGNWSGWELWFGYPKLSRAEHIEKTKSFILSHLDLFVDGDVFSGCPECENGGSGNPQITGDISGYRNFLIEEYKVTKEAFKQIKKEVKSNYFSMNGDVARLIMDKQTTAALDGIVTIDHYVLSPERLVNDIKTLANQSGGKIVLGEFGAPIPDIHGNMDESAQYAYIMKTFSLLSKTKELVGVNYWVNVGGSTHLWNDDGSARTAQQVIRSFFSPKILSGKVINEIGFPINNYQIRVASETIVPDVSGNFSVLLVGETKEMVISAQGYDDFLYSIVENENSVTVTVKKQNESFWFKILKFFRHLYR